MIRDLAMAVPREFAVAGTVILALLALTALAAAFADRRPPYAGVVLLALTVAGGWATQSAYALPWTVDSIARAFIQIVAHIIS